MPRKTIGYSSISSDNNDTKTVRSRIDKKNVWTTLLDLLKVFDCKKKFDAQKNKIYRSWQLIQIMTAFRKKRMQETLLNNF